MKYPQSVAMPRDVEDWLGGELEARGIDALVYTRYILSLMQQDSYHFQHCDWSSKAIWSGQECVDKTASSWQSWDGDGLKRLAVIRCLMSASGQKCEVESLVDELCVKLKEIDSSGVNRSDCTCASTHQSQVPPYVDYNKSFAPLGHREAEMKNTASVWTRGILRASLGKPETDPHCLHEQTNSAQDCLSLNYGNLKMYGKLINNCSNSDEPNKEDVKRLYERSTDDRNLDKVIARLDSTMPQIWNPDMSVYSQSKAPVYAQNQAYFYNNRKLFSPTLFNYRHVEDSVVTTTNTPWSLGGTKETASQSQNETIDLKETQNDATDDVCNISGEIIEEDLLFSARTHFRPIRSDELGCQPPVYADGTTFVISNELEPLQFQRSESGTLFLDTGKYMEFKKADDDNECSGTGDFVPKFRVRQSNEKFCQTDDVCASTELNDAVPIDISETGSDPDEFFFPGDDELALDVGIDDDHLPAEDEIAQIVSAKLNVKWDNSVPDQLAVETSEMWVQWGAENAALVDKLIGDDDDDDDENDDKMMEESEDVQVVRWPQFSSSIWNSNSSLASCGTCKRESNIADEEDASNQIMPKREWQEIWGQPQCKDCKGENAVLKVSLKPVNPSFTTVEKKECKSPIFRTFAFAEIPNNEEPISVNILPENDMGNNNIKSEWDTSETTPGWKWPKLGAALSVYLEESRIRAVEMLNDLDPNDNPKETRIKKANDVALRDIWSPNFTENNYGGSREVWSPLLSQQVNINSQRPLTYCLLRDELSEDGEELLSDLSCLHLEQLGSVDVKEKEFQCEDLVPTSAPSPGWDEGHRFVSLWATWNLIEALGPGQTNSEEQKNNFDTAQKERKRRHSSSQRMCELYLEGECRRPHCRFVHGDDVLPSDMDHHSLRFSHDLQRAFTL